jgi:hypothetical protein
VLVAFGIFICCFIQRPYHLFHFFLTFLYFQCQLASFNSTFIHVFKIFLRLGYLKCSETPLCRQQASFSISKGGIGLVFGEVITSTTYLGRWGFLTPIVVFKFWQDGHSFLLGDIGANDLGPLPFQVHFR